MLPPVVVPTSASLPALITIASLPVLVTVISPLNVILPEVVLISRVLRAEELPISPVNVSAESAIMVRSYAPSIDE